MTGATSGHARASGRVIAQGDLKCTFDSIERDLAAGQCVTADRLLGLRDHTLHWAEKTGNPRMVRRLAKLLAVTGHESAAIALLRKATAIDPSEPQTAFMLSDGLVSQNNPIEALQVLLPILTLPDSPPDALKRAARLHTRLGSHRDSLDLSGELAIRDPDRIGGYLSALIAAGQEDEALLKARLLLQKGSADLKLWQAMYTALRKLGTNSPEVAATRDQLLRCAEASGCSPLWRARLLWQDGDRQAAIAELESHLTASPDDAALLKERASFALAEGYWGRDAAILMRARVRTAPFSPLSRGITQADRLLRAYGGSLEQAAREPEKFAHIKSPECVFDRVVETLPPSSARDSRSGLVMVIGSLAGGGAERILANTFRQFNERRTFEWTKLYVSDLANETGKDFYLPLTGLERPDVIVLNEECEISEPLAWLPRWHAQAASRIFKRLTLDRPAVVHASLEPLNLFAGLAALLAGVPRIVLHTHNMRPSDLRSKNAAQNAAWLRDSYKALLSRPEVSLVGCARACIEDYVDWLGLEDRSRLHVVRNGFDAQEIVTANHPDARQELRSAYGIDSATFVIGTAFRFAEVKQPFLWVDAAGQVAQTHPGCRFVMFGDGELRSATEEYVQTKGLADKFIFPGRVVDIYRRLPLLDVFVLSSRSEALPNVLLEAQAAGVPVVAFDVGGVAEAMMEDVTGILVKGREAGDLAAGILSALAVPQWCRNVRKTGPEFVTKQFSLDGMLYQLRDILQPAGRYRRAQPAKPAAA